VRFIGLVILLSVLTCRTNFKMTTNKKGKWIFCYQFSPGTFRHALVSLTYIYLKAI
jgi:uncharacterized membrane protein